MYMNMYMYMYVVIDDFRTPRIQRATSSARASTRTRAAPRTRSRIAAPSQLATAFLSFFGSKKQRIGLGRADHRRRQTTAP